MTRTQEGNCIVDPSGNLHGELLWFTARPEQAAQAKFIQEHRSYPARHRFVIGKDCISHNMQFIFMGIIIIPGVEVVRAYDAGAILHD